MGFFSCCGGGRGAPGVDEPLHPRPAYRRGGPRGFRRRRKGPRSVNSERDGSVISESEWHDARDAFSFTDEVLSAEDLELSGHGEPEDPDFNPQHSESGSEAFGRNDSPGLFGACLTLLRDSRTPSVEPGQAAGGGNLQRVWSPHSKSSLGRPQAGSSFPRCNPSAAKDSLHNCWDEADATRFSIRSVDYVRTKVKVNSDKAIYRLLAIDLFTTDTKALHVAKHVHLPPSGPPVMVRSGVPGAPDVALPPLLVFNLQLPAYPAGFFGPNDGPGQNFVYYFGLAEDFDPARFENKAALGLLTRFVSNGREADGTMTRDRLKIIARVINVEEWAEKGPLSGAELKLLQNYNEKPVMSRPQHFFYVGPNYLEIDLDIHSYAFLARKALNSYATRLKEVVWEIGFVLQGNAPEELPEQLLGCACIYRTDFGGAGRPWSPTSPGGGGGGGQQQQVQQVVSLTAQQASSSAAAAQEPPP